MNAPRLIQMLAGVAALSVEPCALAQGCASIPTDTPQLGAPSMAPFGNNNPSDPIFSDLRYQVLVPAAQLGNQARHVSDLQVAPAGSRARQFAELTITLGHSAAGALSTAMASNLTGPTYTTSVEAWRLATIANSWTSFGVPVDFDYDPAFGDLVVEFRVRGAGATSGSGTAGFRTDASLPYVWTPGGGTTGTAFAGGGIKLRLCTQTAGIVELLGGCNGTTGAPPRLELDGSAQLGGPGLAVQLTGGPVTPTVAVLVWSVALSTSPVDLALLGAPGCTTHLSADLLEPAMVAQGTATRTLAIPATAPADLALWTQWIVLDPGANSFGASFSNEARALLGH